MCGIAGILADAAPETLEAAVARMVERQSHRGPDDRRIVTAHSGATRLVLGFDRLAILDRSVEAAQPMRDAATGSWLVFNGEIYDFRSVRATLEARGRRFRSTGDAEVLLVALAEWGADALRRVRGMYAFAFYDAPRRRLLLGRDPFGMKPLLYGRVGGAFVFASELRAIQAANLGPLGVDREGLAGYLAYGAVPEPHSIVREVRMLAPGHVVEIGMDDGDERVTPVWTLRDELAAVGEPIDRPWDEVVRETRAALAESVAAHLVSDVPVGVLLSSGVDSSIVASLAAAAAPGGDVAFLTVGFDEAAHSEAPAARLTARALGVPHDVVHVTQDDVLAVLPEFLNAMDQPTADGVNTFVIARAAAARGRTVLLSGIGGDELFGGYTTFRKAPWLSQHAPWLAPLGRAARRLGVAGTSPLGKVAAAQSVRSLRDAYLVQRGLGWDMPAVDPARLGLSGAAREACAVPDGLSSFRAVSFLELSFYLRNQLLRDADVMSSASSIEMRVPFADPAVLRAAWAVGGEAHVGIVGPQKRVLRAVWDALRPVGPPAGAKRGFVFPWAAWLRGPLGEHVAATLGCAGRLEALGLPGDLGRRVLTTWQRGDGSGWLRPWSLYTLLEWQRRSGLEVAA